MVGADDLVPFYMGAVAEVRAHVRAEGGLDDRPPVLGSIEHEVLVEVAQRAHCAGGELVRPADLEPAGGHDLAVPPHDFGHVFKGAFAHDTGFDVHGFLLWR